MRSAITAVPSLNDRKPSIHRGSRMTGSGHLRNWAA